MKSELMISHRVHDTQAPPLVELGKLASSMDDCISLGQGAPYYSPPQSLLDQFATSLGSTTIHRYTPDPGLPEVRRELAGKLQQDQGISVSADSLVLTPGANQAFYNVLLTISDPGDEIILLTPFYFNHYMACSSLNVVAKLVPLDISFKIDYSRLQQAITDKTRAIVVVNPGNPSGKVLTEQDLKSVIELAQQHDLLVIADETYEYFTYSDSTHIPLAPYDPARVISISSFSKTFGIPGWRLGYYTGPQEIIDESIKVQDTIGICAPHPTQLLGKLLLQQRENIIPTFVNLMETNYSLSRDLIQEIDWLEAIPGGGAYYLFPKQLTGKHTMKLVRELIQDYGVYIVPGGGFGPSWEDYCRLSFANVREEALKDAFARLKSYGTN